MVYLSSIRVTSSGLSTSCEKTKQWSSSVSAFSCSTLLPERVSHLEFSSVGASCVRAILAPHSRGGAAGKLV
eukprot:4928770-Prymnesium_polylepis.1